MYPQFLNAQTTKIAAKLRNSKMVKSRMLYWLSRVFPGLENVVLNKMDSRNMNTPAATAIIKIRKVELRKRRFINGILNPYFERTCNIFKK